MFRNGWEALPDVQEWWEALTNTREWSGDPSGCPGAPTGCLVVVGWLSRMSRSGQDTLPDVRDWSGCSPGCP